MQSRNKDDKKNAWIINKKMHMPKKKVKHDKKSDEWVEVAEGYEIIYDNDRQK